MKLWQRFMLLGLIGVMLLVPPTWLFLRENHKAIAFSALEQSGLQPGEQALLLLQKIQQHRGLSAAFIGGGQLSDQRAAKQAEVEQVLAGMARMLQTGKSARMFTQIRADWNSLAHDVSVRTINTLQSYQRHTAQCEFILLFIEQL